MRANSLAIILLLLLVAENARSFTCTVDNSGSIPSPDYISLASALSGCRGPFPDLDVILLCQGSYNLNGLVIPSHIDYLELNSFTGSPADLEFTDVGFSQDTVDYASRPNIAIFNATFQLNNSTNPLFVDTLVNQNFTMSDCIINSTAAQPAFISQEVCRNDMVRFVFQRNLITNVAGQLMNMTGLSGFTITDNNCRFCGTNLTVGQSLVYIKQSDVPQFARIFNFNDFYRRFNCRELPRCLYGWPDSNAGLYARCNEGRVECYDEVRTLERGPCPLVAITLVDPDTNATEVVMEPDPACRVYGPCACTVITYLNASRANQQVSVSNGNLVYGGNTVKVVLPCRPRITDPFGKVAVLYQNIYFAGRTYRIEGEDVSDFPNSFNDRTSSGRVGAGYTLTLSQNNNYGGSQYNLTGYNSDLRSADFNDRTSSARWVPVPWTSSDVPLWNSTIQLPLPLEFDVDIGYYRALWRQPTNLIYSSAKNPLLVDNYPFSFNSIVRPSLYFQNGTFFCMFFDAGQIVPRNCPVANCQFKPGGDNLPCNYTVYPGSALSPSNDTQGTLQNTPGENDALLDDEDYLWPYPVTPFNMEDYLGSQCFQGDVYCCKTPDDATPNYPAYAIDCSQSPNATIPVLNPDGTLSGNLTQIPNQVYHCTYLVNCTYDTANNELDSCKQFHCGLSPCRLNTTYEPTDDCYSILHIGQPEACNASNPAASGDRVCSFLLNDCLDYYYNGYLKDGYVFAADAASSPGSTVIPSVCEFAVDTCVAFIAAAGLGEPVLDTLCYCSSCSISAAANGGCSLAATVNPPLPGQDVQCYSAVQAACSSATSLADCVNNVAPDQCCQAAQVACNWNTLPPYEGVVNGELCYSTVQTFFTSAVSTTDCMNPLFITSDVGCLLARASCEVDRLTRPPNLPCLYASVNGATPSPAPTNTAFPAPATYPPDTTTAPAALDPCFDLSVASPNASCTTARATCYVYTPQPYMFPDPSCYYTQYTATPSAVPLYQCMDPSFTLTDAACDSARAACSDRQCFDLFGLGANNAFVDCSNPYSTNDQVDSFCLWHRLGCSVYYNAPTAELLAGYCFSSDPTCVGTVIPDGCELDADVCAATGDTRCTCTINGSSFPTSPDVPISQVTDIIYGLDAQGIPYVAPLDGDGNQWPIFEPSSDPVRLPRPLRFPDPSMVCPTMMWAGCDCPPMLFQHASAVFQSCNNFNGTGFCDPDTYSYDVIASQFNDPSIANSTLYTWPRNDYSTTYLNQQINIPGLFCSARSKLMKCDCSFSRLVSVIDPPVVNSTAIFLDNLQFNETDMRIVDNSACDYYYGLRQDQEDATLQRQKMFAIPGFADSFSAMRDPYRNPNDYIIGQFAFVTNPRSYDPRFCNDGCPQTLWGGLPDYINQEDADYIIDCGVSTASPAYGTTIFKSFYHISVSDAQGDGRRVYVRDCGRVYTEPMPFSCPPNDAGCDQDQQSDELTLRFTGQQTNWIFFSYDEPKVQVADLQIETPKVQGITFQGIHFLHPGETRDRMFRLVNAKGRNILTSLNFLNCEFDGQGVTGAGIISIIGEVRTLVFSHCNIKNWNVEAVYANRVRNFVFIGNVVSKCIGNVIHPQVIDIYSIRDNTFIDSAGGGKIKGAATITVTATYDLFDARVLFATFIDNDDFLTGLSRTCLNTTVPLFPPYFPGAIPRNLTDPYTIWQLQCNVWNNVGIRDLLDDDFPDTFIEIWNGAYNGSLARGNAVFKAQFGIALYGVSNFDPTPDNLARLAMDNPLVQPSKYRSPDVPAGADYKGITPFTWIEFTFGLDPRARDSWQANWPANGDIAQMFREGNISCVVNNAYSERTIEDSYHFNVLWYQYRWGYGFAEYRNNSIATLACNDFRDYGFPPVNAPEIYTLPWSGSEYIRDNVTLFQNVRLYGNPAGAFKPGIAVTLFGTNITVIMDQGVPLPTPCSQANGVKPCIRSQGNTVSALFARFDDLCWQPFGSALGINLWSTGGTAPVSFESYRCDYDGRNLLPLSNVYSLLIYCGTIIPGNDQTAPQETDQLPLPTSCRIYFNGNSVANFTSYDASRVSVTTRGLVRRVKLTNYPFASGPVFYALNSLNTDTAIECLNNTIENIDRTALTIRNFINATIEGNIMYNCSMRSIGNTACVFLEANGAYSTVPDVSNDEPPGAPLWKFNSNRMSQEKVALTPYTANTAFPTLVPGLYVRAFSANTTFCMFNNTIKTYPIGTRFTDFNFTVLKSCPAPGQVVGFPDAQRYLRFIAENNGCQNPDINGTIHDLEITFAGTALEAIRDAIYCDLCCPPGPPTACWVDTTTILFNPSHPWWDFAVFNSINRAITNCNVSSANIFVIGQSDPFLAYDGLPAPFHVYTEVISSVVPPPYVNQSNAMRIIGDVGMIVLANGHWLSNPNNRTVSVEGFTFVDTGSSALPLWDFTLATRVTNDISILNSEMIGNGTATNRAIDGTFDGQFIYQGNTHINYSTTISNARFNGENCAARIDVIRNTWTDQYGNVLEFHANNGRILDNRFVRCGGSAVPADTDRWVAFVNPTCLGVVGEIRINKNRFTPPPTVDVNPGRTLWTSLFVDPVPWNLVTSFLVQGPNDVKFFQFYDTRTDGLQIGLRMDHIQPTCTGNGDPQFFLRLIMYSRFRNARVEGSEFDLYIGPFDNTEEQTRIALRDAHENPPHPEDTERCYHCEDGCPVWSFQIGAIVLLTMAIVALLLCCLTCAFCGERFGCCLCFPPTGLRLDPTTGMQYPEYWPYWRYLFPGLDKPNLRTGKPYSVHPDAVGMAPNDRFASQPFGTGQSQEMLYHRGAIARPY